jgi:hypothetical protein
VHVHIRVRGSGIHGASALQHCVCLFPDREIPDRYRSIDFKTIGFQGFG